MTDTIRGIMLAMTMAVPMTLQPQGMVTSADSARHALQRLSWGPSAGEVETIARTGVLRWIDRQFAASETDDPARREQERGRVALVTPTADLVRDDAERRRAQVATRSDSQRMPAGARSPNLVRQVNVDFAALTLERATTSTHQLAEVLADFWTNHFNVFLNKGLDRVLLRDHVEHAIRPHVMGRFEDLLLATARSPAMLFYLDNVQSVAERSMPESSRRRLGQPNRPQIEALRARMPRGINENYSRELLELHTLGVDGGYSQQDVEGVARIFTGWGLDRRTGRFAFNAAAHDREPKTVLGVQFASGGGADEGERLIRMLANHSATMHHISAKLCARLVADLPPDGCVDDAVRAWQRSGGEMVEVVRAIITGPDFWAAAHRNAKVKTPQEFVVSAVRALDADLVRPAVLVSQLNLLGQGLFQQSAPTGWPEAQEEWVNSGALLARMNFAVALAGNRIPGIRVDLGRVTAATADHAALLDAIDQQLLGGAMQPATRQAILREIADLGEPVAARAMAVGLALGGPDFQRQ
jgi:uncharacterized protein (DUF1800 family)